MPGNYFNLITLLVGCTTLSLTIFAAMSAPWVYTFPKLFRYLAWNNITSNDSPINLDGSNRNSILGADPNGTNREQVENGVKT
jgi:hypothetical protein